MDIGMKIKDARKAKVYTLEELGNMLGVQKSAVAKYESGRIKNIKRSTLKKISEILDIPPAELIFEEEQKEKPINEDELSAGVRELIEFCKSIPKDKENLFLKVVQSIAEDFANSDSSNTRNSGS
jgi:transcriptional regulator with XRE-family HTH domain